MLLIGAPALALEHYRAMQIKQIQHDTLSHLVLSRASTFSLASTGDLTLASECLESTQIYLSNSQEVSRLLFKQLSHFMPSRQEISLFALSRLKNTLK
jgi:N-terminal acetyltransferase B complex non-catalytic subunit